MNHRRRKLLKEGRVRETGFDTDAQDSRWIAFFVNVNKVKLSSSEVCINSVLGWSMDVPAAKVDSGVVVSEAGVLSVDAFFVGQSESRTEAAIVEVALVSATVVEARLVGQCRTMFSQQTDR